jgi:hypothetical protein
MLGLGLGINKSGGVLDPAKAILNGYIIRVTAAGGYIEGTQCAYLKMKELSNIP